MTPTLIAMIALAAFLTGVAFAMRLAVRSRFETVAYHDALVSERQATKVLRSRRRAERTLTLGMATGFGLMCVAAGIFALNRR